MAGGAIALILRLRRSTDPVERQQLRWVAWAAGVLAFIYIARGSAGEVRSMLCLKERRARNANWPADVKSQIANLKSVAESCSRQLRGWADSLQNSEIKGQRHLNRRTREQDEQTKKAKSLQKDLLRKLPPGHPLRRDAETRGLI